MYKKYIYVITYFMHMKKRRGTEQKKKKKGKKMFNENSLHKKA